MLGVCVCVRASVYVRGGVMVVCVWILVEEGGGGGEGGTVTDRSCDSSVRYLGQAAKRDVILTG